MSYANRMLVVVVYYLFLTVFFLPFGVVTEKFLSIRNNSLAVTMLLGIVFQTVILTVTAFFFRLNSEVFIFNMLLFLILLIRYNKLISTKFKSGLAEFRSWQTFYKFVFALIVILVLAKSSQLPFVIDNESYYLQTIKWFNEYGFVKGLGNLHIYLAQGSPWHVLQAGLNFSFVTEVINDINGFVFIVCSFYYLNEYYKQNEQTWIIYLLVFNVLFFQFLDAPSPDLPIVLVLPILFYWFIYQKNLKMAILFFVFLVFIKITIAPLVVLLFFWKKDLNAWRYFGLTGVFFAVLWVIKNSLLSGYPLYPFAYFSLAVDWLVPRDMLVFVARITENSGYFIDNPSEASSLVHKLKSWILLGGITGLFNKSILMLFAFFPLTNSFKNQRNYKVLYFVLLLHFILLLYTSPQFRFFLPEILFFSAVILDEILIFIGNKKKLSKSIVLTSVLLPVVFMFPIHLTQLTPNPNHQLTDSFEIEQLLCPKPSSKFYAWQFEQKQKGNLEYYSPVESQFYNTGNAELPAVSESMLNYFEKKYHIFPQQRTRLLRDGFYSKHIKDSLR